MINTFTQLAYLGPGGPEFLLIMLVLLVMFGAKDAPRILRKLNEVINQVRNTADSFKREVMYGDLNSQNTSPSENMDDHDYGEEYYDEDYHDMDDEEDNAEEVFEEMAEELNKKSADVESEPEDVEPEESPSEQPEEEDGDASKV